MCNRARGVPWTEGALQGPRAVSPGSSCSVPPVCARRLAQAKPHSGSDSQNQGLLWWSVATQVASVRQLLHHSKQQGIQHWSGYSREPHGQRARLPPLRHPHPWGRGRQDTGCFAAMGALLLLCFSGATGRRRSWKLLISRAVKMKPHISMKKSQQNLEIPLPRFSEGEKKYIFFCGLHYSLVTACLLIPQVHFPATHTLSYTWDYNDGCIWPNFFGTLQRNKIWCQPEKIFKR